MHLLGPTALLGLAVLIFRAIQLPLSAWWLARQERGPMAALWARLTYGPAVQAALKPPAAAA